MIIKKGTVLNIKHQRKGNFTAVALKDFDSDKAEFYPLALTIGFNNESSVKGMNTIWTVGEQIPCKASFCKFEVAKNENKTCI